MYSFKSLDTYTIFDKKYFAVRNPVKCMDFKHLVGQETEIDGVNYHIYDVEHFKIFMPYPEGKPIGLLVERPEQQNNK
jgi:hypothetical protein